MFIPPGYPITENRVLDEYQQVLRFLRETQDSWTPLVTHILGKGVTTVSLEYKVNDGVFSFIDWDTEDDDKVL